MSVIFRILSIGWFVFVYTLFFPSSENIGVKSTNSTTINVSSNFEAISDGKKVIVNWTGLGDKSYDYFTVEKSKDGVHFYSALMVKSFGRQTNSYEYSDIDYSPFTGVSYYRLRQNDYYGEFSYSPVVTVNCQMLSDGTVKPLSDIQSINRELKAMEGKAVLVVLRDVKGEEHICKIFISTESNIIYARDTNKALDAGNYIVIASSCNPLYQQKLTVK